MGKEAEPRRQRNAEPVFSSWDIDRTIRLGRERERLGVRGQALSYLEELQVRKVELEVLEGLVSKGSLPPHRLREYKFLFDLFASTPDRNPQLKKELEKMEREESARKREARKRKEVKRVKKEKRKVRKEKVKRVKERVRRKEVKKAKKKEARPVIFELDGKKVRGKVGLVLRWLHDLGKSAETASGEGLAKTTGLSKTEVSRAIGYAREYVLPGTRFEIKSVISDSQTGESKIVESETELGVGQRVNYLFREKPVESLPEVNAEPTTDPESSSQRFGIEN